jgi:hypothetical protein
MLFALLFQVASAQDVLVLLRHADVSTVARALEGGLVPAGAAEVAIERGDREIVALLAGRGVRLPEGASLLSWAPDLVRMELALQLGAPVRPEDIVFFAQASQQHLLRRLAAMDQLLPPSAWSPRRVGPTDPGTEQVLREIVREKRRQRR